MAAKKSKLSVYTLSAIGVMTAVSFISNFISIPIGTLTRIHMGNEIGRASCRERV